MNEYPEPSCASCAYAQRDFNRSEYNFDIGCKYPFFGDIQEHKDRESILKHFYTEFIANAKECGSYLSIEQAKEEGLE